MRAIRQRAVAGVLGVILRRPAWPSLRNWFSVGYIIVSRFMMMLDVM